MKQSTQIIITIIMTAIVVSLCIVGYYYKQDRQEVHDAEVYFNGTKYGQAMLIREIQTTGQLPFFNSTGHLNVVSFEVLCQNLNSQTGGQNGN